jgi:hypothetical protein
MKLQAEIIVCKLIDTSNETLTHAKGIRNDHETFHLFAAVANLLRSPFYSRSIRVPFGFLREIHMPFN